MDYKDSVKAQKISENAITKNCKRWRGGRRIEMKNQLWKFWKGHCYQLLYCATKKNCYSAECWLETIQGQGICSLILSPPTTGHLATYVASPLGICHPRKKTLMPWWGRGGGVGACVPGSKRGRGGGEGEKCEREKGPCLPNSSLPPPSLPQATRVYNLIYGRPRNISPQ